MTSLGPPVHIVANGGDHRSWSTVERIVCVAVGSDTAPHAPLCFASSKQAAEVF